MHAVPISIVAIIISLVTALVVILAERRFRRMEKDLKRLRHLLREPTGRDVWPPS